MDNVVKEENKKKNVIIGVLVCVIVLLVAALVYFVFIKKDESQKIVKPLDNQQTENENKDLQSNLEKINEEVFKMLHEETTVEEFKKQAKQYFIDEMIVELEKYYNKDTKTICLESSVCEASGGFFGETTDILFRKFEIINVEADIINAKGIYGEASDNISGETEITYQKENNIWKIKKFDILDFSNEGVYKTVDGKFTFKIAAHTNEAYLNNELFNYTDVKYDERYAFYSGYFEGEARQDDYHFLIDKETGIIVEKDFETVSKLNDKDLRFYGEGDLSKNINFIKCAAGYYFVDDFAIEGSIVEIYTTDWKLLGYVDIDNIKSDKDGVYVYEDYEPFDKLVGNPTKYDINGNKIN